jgi:hypothetical protein
LRNEAQQIEHRAVARVRYANGTPPGTCPAIRGSAVNRTDESRTIAVVRTRLPYTDRRSLSQAWFSALHLSEEASAPPPVRAGRALASAVPVSGRREMPGCNRGASGAGRSPACEPPFRGAARALPRGGGGEWMPARAVRARAPGDAPPAVARRHAPLRTSLTVGVAGERVALLLRRDGATLHVIAVCRPAVENAVRHALALAAAQMREHGDAVRATVRALEGRQS